MGAGDSPTNGDRSNSVPLRATSATGFAHRISRALEGHRARDVGQRDVRAPCVLTARLGLRAFATQPARRSPGPMRLVVILARAIRSRSRFFARLRLHPSPTGDCV